MLISSLMADLAISGSKLSVASGASQCQGINRLPIGLGFAFSVLSVSFTDSRFFIMSCSFVDETSLIDPVQPVPKTVLVCRNPSERL